MTTMTTSRPRDSGSPRVPTRGLAAIPETRQTVEMVASVAGHRPPARAERWLD